MKKRVVLLVCLAVTVMTLSFYGNSLAAQTGQTPVGVIAGDVLYKGVGVSRIFDERLENTVGTPLNSRGPHRFYDGLEISLLTEGVDVIQGTKPGLFTFNGVTLNKNRAGLTAAIGKPIEYYKYRDYEYRSADDTRMIRYHMSNHVFDYMVDFWFDDTDGEASSMSIKRIGQ